MHPFPLGRVQFIYLAANRMTTTRSAWPVMQMEFEWPPKAPPKGESEGLKQPMPVADEKTELLPKAEALRAELTERTGKAIRLHLTDNRSRMLSLRPDPAGGYLSLRLHHMFLDAPPPVRAALATWVQNPKDGAAGKIIDAFVRAHKDRIRSKTPRSIRVRTTGRHFDLKALYATVNAHFFNNAVQAHITWGRMPTRRVRRSIRFGSYNHEHRLIRIHPLLDQEFVPQYIVRYIVFHEMLHAMLGVEESPNGRRRLHPPRFRKMEQAYPDYERAAAWIDTPGNLRRLLRCHE